MKQKICTNAISTEQAGKEIKTIENFKKNSLSLFIVLFSVRAAGAAARD